MKDSLGDRMKVYENAFRFHLPIRMPLIIRVDGKAFHSYTKGLQKPWDESLLKVMDAVAKHLCKEVQGAQLAYVQSDEISILVHNYKRLSSSSWFDNNLQKISSVSAGIASAYFTYYSDHVGNSGVLRPAIFDARAFVLPEQEVCNYFIWRQQDATRNSIQMLGRSYFSHKQLDKKSCTAIQDMLMVEHNVNWNDLSSYYKRGRCIVKDQGWKVDRDIPIFSQDRYYLEQHLERLE